MISKIVAFKSSDGQTFDTLEKVQQHEIELILNAAAGTAANTNDIIEIQTDVAANSIVKHAAQVVDILSTKPSSRPAARKANGAVRKKRGAALAQTIQHSETGA